MIPLLLSQNTSLTKEALTLWKHCNFGNMTLVYNKEIIVPNDPLFCEPPDPDDDEPLIVPSLLLSVKKRVLLTHLSQNGISQTGSIGPVYCLFKGCWVDFFILIQMSRDM